MMRLWTSVFAAACLGVFFSVQHVFLNEVAAEAPTRLLSDSNHVETDEELILDEEAEYDDEGWHMGKHDFVSVVVRPERLQPFYLMPVSFASKLILTMLIFGFGLSFQEVPPERFPCERAVKRVVQQIAGCGMIAMALNGYYVDGKRIFLACQQLELSSQRWAVAFITCLTSANYIAARAIWNSLDTENPTKLLNLKPKDDVRFSLIPIINIPLCPGLGSWIPCLKHIYALLLLPYFVPYMVAQFGLGCFVWVWCCSTKCVVFIGMCVANCRTCAAFFGVIFTLFLWPWPRKCFLYWWGVYWPAYYALAIQIWAAWITPIIFSFIYGALARISPKSIVRGLLRGLEVLTNRLEVLTNHMKRLIDLDPEVLTNPEGLTNPEVLTKLVDEKLLSQEQIIKQLVKWNAEQLKLDFEVDFLFDEECLIPITDVGEAKVTIFFDTLSKMAVIIAEQCTLIFFVRALFSSNYVGYMGCMFRTITERTWVKYTSSLQTDAMSTTHQVLDTVWMLI
jgi:hypothetical protein